MLLGPLLSLEPCGLPVGDVVYSVFVPPPVNWSNSRLRSILVSKLQALMKATKMTSAAKPRRLVVMTRDRSGS